MKWLPALALCALAAVSTSALGSRPPPPWWRPFVPIQRFSFVAEITPTVLQDGALVAVDNSGPAAWTGQQFTGVMTLNLNQAEESLGGPLAFSWTDGNPAFERYGNWMTVDFTAPDGSSHTFPSTVAHPLPSGPGNQGTLTVDDGWNNNGPDYGPSLSVARTFANQDGSFQQSFSLGLEAAAGEALLWTDGCCGSWTELPYLHVDASQASVTNAGQFFQRDDNGASFGFGFMLRSVTHMAPVPEPATWAMLIAGVGLLGATRRMRG